LFDKVKLPDPLRIYESYPHELSGGQLQRVMIAMAISCKPKVLIADEPTTALDVTVQKAIIQLLKELNEENGNSTIFITHDLGVINEIADKVLVMYKGEVMEYGPIDQVFHNPTHPYTKGLLACRPPMDRRYSRLPIVDDFMRMEATDHETYVNNLVQSEQAYHDHLESLESSDIILEANNIKKYYVSDRTFFGRPKSYVKAVDDVSFKIRKGESIGLVGESGCGKSTLGRVLLCLDGLHGSNAIRKDKVIELLEKVGLEADHYNRYPHQFSGGQRQRICIARSLGLNPKFILCDESVSALDVSVQAQVLNLLQDLKDEFGLSYLFISHDLSVIKFIADHVLVMQKGKIVEQGDVESVINDPQDSYTQMLINSIPK